MSLIINNPSINPVNVNSPINITYTNKGNALVRHVLSIDDDNPTTPPLPTIINDWQGYLTFPRFFVFQEVVSCYQFFLLLGGKPVTQELHR